MLTIVSGPSEGLCTAYDTKLGRYDVSRGVPVDFFDSFGSTSNTVCPCSCTLFILKKVKNGEKSFKMKSRNICQGENRKQMCRMFQMSLIHYRLCTWTWCWCVWNNAIGDMFDKTVCSNCEQMTCPEKKIHRKRFILKGMGWVSCYGLDLDDWYLKSLNLGYVVIWPWIKKI